jgi:hypothetical protein
MMRRGKPGCRCKEDPPQLHGPYIQWTRTVAGKTVTQLLSEDQLARYQPWFENARELRELLTQLEAISIDAIIKAEGWGSQTRPRSAESPAPTRPPVPRRPRPRTRQWKRRAYRRLPRSSASRQAQNHLK